MREDLGSDHNTIIGVFSHTPIIDELPTKTVMPYNKAYWEDINQTITNTMNYYTLNGEARLQNSCYSAQPETFLIGTSHYMAKPSAKFIGITFDTTLSFTNHFHTISLLARQRLLKLLLFLPLPTGHLHPPPSPSTTISIHHHQTVQHLRPCSTRVR